MLDEFIQFESFQNTQKTCSTSTTQTTAITKNTRTHGDRIVVKKELHVMGSETIYLWLRGM